MLRVDMLTHAEKLVTALSVDESLGAKPLSVTVATARNLSGLGNTTIWALIKDGRLATVHVGRRTLITFASLERLLTPSSTAPPPPRRRGRPRKDVARAAT
jgi:excisionase family DNA binding protein